MAAEYIYGVVGSLPGRRHGYVQDHETDDSIHVHVVTLSEVRDIVPPRAPEPDPSQEAVRPANPDPRGHADVERHGAAFAGPAAEPVQHLDRGRCAPATGRHVEVVNRRAERPREHVLAHLPVENAGELAAELGHQKTVPAGVLRRTAIRLADLVAGVGEAGMDRLAVEPFAEREPRVEIRLPGGETYPHEGLPRRRIRIAARPTAGRGRPP